MEKNYTQGEWRIAPNKLVIVKGNTNDIISDCDRTDELTCISKIEMEANAKLIAAAPELLEVLLDLRDGNYPFINGGLWTSIDQAIKKATE